MAKEWMELAKFVQGEQMVVQKVMLPGRGLSIEGEFELPPVARLSFEDQVFVATFIRTHGNIRHMEQIYGVSYPTIKARLNRLSEAFDFVQVEKIPDAMDVLNRLDGGEIDVAEALRRLEER